MTRRSTVTAHADLLLEWASAHGLTVEAVEITVDGSVRVLTHRPPPGVAVNDDLDWVSLAGAKAHTGRA